MDDKTSDIGKPESNTLPNSKTNERQESLFTREEIRSIVKEFITAFVNGEITIDFKTAEEFLIEAKFSKQKMDLQEALAQEVEAKAPFYHLLNVSAGCETSSSCEEKEKAINDLFASIIRMRQSQRIKGKFMTFDVEEKIAELEKDLVETNKLVAQILLSLKSGVTRS